MYHSDIGTVLRYYPYKENGLVVVIATESHGVRPLIAKGVRGKKAQVSLDLFYKVELTWMSSSRSELGALTESQLLHPREGIRRQYSSIMLATYFTKIWEKSMENHQESPELYDLLERALNFLHEKTPTLKALLHFEKQLAELHGILHPHQSPEECLKEFLGNLPKQRQSAIEHFSSSTYSQN